MVGKLTGITRRADEENANVTGFFFVVGGIINSNC